MSDSNNSLVIAHPEYLEPLEQELNFYKKQKLLDFKALDSDCFFVESRNNFDVTRLIWPLQVWTNAKLLNFESIKKASSLLSKDQGPWQNLSTQRHRRAQLISSQTHSVKTRPQVLFRDEIFLDSVWRLIDANTLVTGKHWGPRTPLRTYIFAENKEDPPSRAYLKLWELYNRIQYFPTNRNFVELGASPGGWTWVNAELNCRVWAFDKAELSKSLSKNPNIYFHKKDIFKVHPNNIQEFVENSKTLHGVFSDVIAETTRLTELARTWSDSKKEICVFTIKFKGSPNMEPVYKLLNDFPNSRALHLEANKNEITWYLLNKD